MFIVNAYSVYTRFKDGLVHVDTSIQTNQRYISLNTNNIFLINLKMYDIFVTVEKK